MDIEIKENNNIQQEETYYGVGSFLWEVVKIFLWAMVIIIPIRIFLFQPFFVQGASMEPNFLDSDYLIVNELGYKTTSFSFAGANFFTAHPFRELSRGEIIIFRYPKDPRQFFIKRIIGLPGEKVKIENGQVKIFNQQHQEGYLLDESGYLSSAVPTIGSLEVSLNGQQYFVMGDNRTHSSDSRVWGPVPIEDIVGKVLLRAWPLNKVEVY